jgi:PAS domain S-box-containing protein
VAYAGTLAASAAVLRTRTARAQDRMELLGAIARTVDPRKPLAESFAGLAHLLVPAAADLCEIVLVEAGAPQRLLTRLAGAEPEREQELAARPVDERIRAIAEGASGAELLDRATAARLFGAGAGERGGGARAPRMRSAMLAPIRGGGETLGVLTLATAGARRRYRPDDLVFARTVASRAALAALNARLFDELREAEERMEAIVGSLGEAVTIRDPSDRIVYANDAALASMGFSSVEEIRARPPQSIMRDYLVLDEQGNEVRMQDIPSVRLLRGEQPDPLLIHTVHRERGIEKWSLLKSTPLYGRSGRLEAAVTIIEDVTATKRAEMQTRFLSRASELLASSLDYEETLRNVAWLAVPEIADWCTVDLVDSRGRRRRVVVAHPDVEKLALAERLRHYDASSDRGLAAVLRTGRPELYPDIPPALLEQGARDEEHLRLLREVDLRSALIVPLRAGARIVGAMTLVTAESGRRYSEEDLRFAEQIAARAAVAVENSRLYTQRSQIAATLQRSLLPEALPDIGGWEIASLYRPASAGGEVEVGGDFYDAFPTGEGWLVLIGDVTGKGIEAAAMTSLVRHGARFIGEQVPEPAEILRRLHATLAQRSTLSLCSALCVRIEGDHICFASAGHPLPLLVTDDGVRELGRTGPVLGAFPHGEWPTHELALRPTEVLLLYTDGVTDTVGAAGRFGEHRLRRTVAECGPLAPEELLARLERALAEFQQGEQADDTAALALRLAPAPAATHPPEGISSAHEG